MQVPIGHTELITYDAPEKCTPYLKGKSPSDRKSSRADI